MHKKKALLEIGVEELPSSEVLAIRNQLREKIEKSLQASRLGLDYTSMVSLRSNPIT